MDEAKSGAAAKGAQEHHCIACGRVFSCGLDAGTGKCWCMDEPTRIAMPASPDAECYCPECLEARLPPATA